MMNGDTGDDEEHVDEICSRVYLGDRIAGGDVDLLTRLNVTHVITAELIPAPRHVTSALPHLAVLHVPLADLQEEDLLSHLEKTTRFIREGVEGGVGGSVLVHCYHGVSRSAAIVAAYLMKTRGIGQAEALDYVQAKRPGVGPNVGFRNQLRLFEEMGCKLDARNKAFKYYKLCSVREKVIHTKILPSEVRGFNNNHSAAAPELESDLKTSGALYRCKKCRTVLTNGIKTIPHFAAKTHHNPLKWTSMIGENFADSSAQCKKAVFSEPLRWMGKAFSDITGKLHCGKCGQKVGSFDWCDAVHCPCGASMTPGFVLIMSKVDRCIMVKDVEDVRI